VSSGTVIPSESQGRSMSYTIGRNWQKLVLLETLMGLIESSRHRHRRRGCSQLLMSTTTKQKSLHNDYISFILPKRRYNA